MTACMATVLKGPGKFTIMVFLNWSDVALLLNCVNSPIGRDACCFVWVYPLQLATILTDLEMRPRMNSLRGVDSGTMVYLCICGQICRCI